MSNGEWIRFDNGFKQIFFSMENLEVGEWELIVKEKIETQDVYEDKVDIWLTQETLNKFITVSPADVFTTITSLGNIENLLCVGNYNEQGLNAEQSSGRGFTRDNFIKPTLITTGKNIPAAVGKGQWGEVNGSVVAMAKMAGAASVIYSKLIEEGKRWFPNTLVMASIMLSHLERIEGIDYPNESQGNGIFNQESLDKVLKIIKNINF